MTFAIAPLAAAWLWVTWEITRTADVIAQLRARAKRVPLWITATAWTTLWAAAWL